MLIDYLKPNINNTTSFIAAKLIKYPRNSKNRIGGRGTKANVLISTLQKAHIDSKEKLMKRWKKEPKFMLSAVMPWYEKGSHAALASVWPPKE